MYIDVLGRVCNAQAFTAAAVSLSSIDLGPAVPVRDIAPGEPMGFALAAIVAASATTIMAEIIQADDALLTTGIVVLAEYTLLSADLPVGKLAFLPLPQGVATPKRYLGLRVTPTGGAATITLTAWLTAHDLFSMHARHYADAITITG